MNTKNPGAPSWPNLSQVKQRQPENLLKSKSGVILPIARPPAVKVLQAKTLFPARIAGQTATGPKAPPVYRPQPAPKVLQQKSAIIQRQASAKPVNRPIAPPVYKPTAVWIAQQKTVASGRTARLPERSTHPIARPAVLQQKTPVNSVQLPRPSASTTFTRGLQRLTSGQNRQPARANTSCGINGTKYPGQQFRTPAIAGNRQFPIQRITVTDREYRGLDSWPGYNPGQKWIGTRKNGYPHTSIFYTTRQIHPGDRWNDPRDISYTFTEFHYSTDAKTHYHYVETTHNHWERRDRGNNYPEEADDAANEVMAIIGGTADRGGTYARQLRLAREAEEARVREAQAPAASAAT